jgi:hypothetical protein
VYQRNFIVTVDRQRSRQNGQILLNGLKTLAFEWRTCSAACSPFVPEAEPGSIAQLSTRLVNCLQAVEKPESALMEDPSNALRDRPIEK